ncbi:MAG: hypothetical protein ACLGI6_20165 [Gammaproteobacteria bacterium]
MLAVGLSVLAAVLTALYPLVLWFGQGRVEPRHLALLLVVLALARLPALKVGGSARYLVAGALLLAGAAVLANAALPLKLYPVLVNAALLAAFGASLASPQSMIERLARLREPDLPPAAVAYTRNVTKIWCGFFAVNGTIALVTALWMSAAAWSLYNGVIAYVAMGVLFGVEYLVRLRFKRLHSVLPHA